MRAPSLLLTALCVGGCATLGDSPLKSLHDDVEGYMHAFKWKNYDRAALYLPAEQRQAFFAAYEDGALQIEDYKVMRVQMNTEEDATINVHLTFMMLPSVTVEKAKLVQHWHKINGRWTLEAEEGSIRDLKDYGEPEDETVSKERTPPKGFEGETETFMTEEDEPPPFEDSGD